MLRALFVVLAVVTCGCGNQEMTLDMSVALGDLEPPISDSDLAVNNLDLECPMRTDAGDCCVNTGGACSDTMPCCYPGTLFCKTDVSGHDRCLLGP